MYNKPTKEDIKNLAQRIRDKADQVISNLDNDLDCHEPANDIVWHTTTMVFAMGEFFALKQTATDANALPTTKPVNMQSLKTQVVADPSGTTRKYHNKRDALGRFARV